MAFLDVARALFAVTLALLAVVRAVEAFEDAVVAKS
jgi:hypothetical protein